MGGCARHVVHFSTGYKGNAYFVRKPEGKRPLGSPERRWEDSIKTDLKETGWDSVYWISLPQKQGQVANSCKCGNEPSGSIKCGGVVPLAGQLLPLHKDFCPLNLFVSFFVIRYNSTYPD